MRFAGHYRPWIQARINVLQAHYGEGWFGGKKILELGCGYADIGEHFHHLGADVTCSEVRLDHVEHLRANKAFLNVVQHDLDDESWPYDDDFDLIIHTGVLYHLNSYRANLEHCVRSCRQMFLETEVLDSAGDEVVFTQEDRKLYDQAFNGVGCRPSQLHLEKLLTAAGAKIERCFSSQLNVEFHSYDWQVTNTRTWRHGLRRAWFVQGVCGKKRLPNRLAGLLFPWRRAA